MLSMPHAVGPLDRPFDHLNNLTYRSKQDLLLLPIPKSSSLPSLAQNPQYSRQPSAPAIPTPPSEMQYVPGNTLPPFSQSGIPTIPDPVWGNSRVKAYGGVGSISNTASSSTRHPQESSFTVSRPGSPSQRSVNEPSENGYKRKGSSSVIAPQLQIPDSIITPQSSMPQLAAEITCLFWFESSSTLNEVLSPTSPRKRPTALLTEAIPTTGFRKWVATILSTTQVAQNVILLALLFVYRLKKANPGVRGKLGSEYRLLTVALMLGNKFLDDNTYTNKTWAEVSGISVQEVHVMEVEFLSNMRYSLFTSEKQWKEWHTTLGKFGTYFDRASKAGMEHSRMPSAPPTSGVYASATLPSPPTSTRLSPPFSTSHSPIHGPYSNTPLLLPQVSSTVVSPIGPLPELDFRSNGRKRSHDDGSQGPPPKRPQHHYPPSAVNTASSSHAVTGTTLPRLPNLSIPFSQPLQTPSQVPQLPPPSRAMTMVYPASSQWTQPNSTPTSAVSSSILPQIQQPTNNIHSHSRQLSPFPTSAGASPSGQNFPNQSRLSPSALLQQRQSPYRPVRNVQTLLYPPPSASMHNPSKNVSYDQMQYQPLGRPMTERRAGTLPYMHHEAWPETNQFNQWPVLPEPNLSR